MTENTSSNVHEPAAESPADQNVNDRVRATQQPARRGAKPAGRRRWRAWLPSAIITMSILGIIALFLPVHNRSISMSGASFSNSANFFDEDARGGVIAFFMILALVAGVLAVLVRKSWTRITAAVVAILAGLLTIALIAMSGSGNSLVGGSVGIGQVALFVVSLVLIAAAVVMLTFAKEAQPRD